MLKAFSQKTTRAKIGVVGSILIDIIASTEDEGALDATGKVEALNIGGCAYNISFYLRKLGAQVGIFSAVRDRSPLTPFIIRKLQTEKIDRRWIRFDADVPEGLFVAHKTGTDVTRAVTSTCIDSVSVEPDEISEFVKSYDLIVCDMGLNVDQLGHVLKAGRRYKKHVICNGTSDSRIEKIRHLTNVPPFFALVMNQAESKRLIPNLDELLLNERHGQIRKIAHAKNVIITRGALGMLCIDLDDNIRHYPPVSVREIKSTIGAGDALTACVAMSALDQEENAVLSLDTIGDFDAHMENIMPIALAEMGATRGSAFLFDRRVVKYGFKERKDNTFLRVDRGHWAMAGFALSLTIGLLAWFFPIH